MDHLSLIQRRGKVLLLSQSAVLISQERLGGKCGREGKCGSGVCVLSVSGSAESEERVRESE